MFAIFTFIAFLFLFLNIPLAHFFSLTNRRECFLVASLLWGTLAIVSLELLSLGGLVTLMGLTSFWGILTFVLLVFFLRQIYYNQSWAPQTGPSPWDVSEKFLLGAIFLIIVMVGITGV